MHAPIQARAAGTLFMALSAHCASAQPPTSLYNALVPGGLTGRERISPKTFEEELGSGTVYASVGRLKNERERNWLPLPRERFTAWEIGLRFDQDLGKSDTVGMRIDGLMDRRPAVSTPLPPQSFSSAALSSGVTWTHGKSFRAVASYLVSGPLRSRSPIERTLERASGGMPGAKGLRLALEVFGEIDEQGGATRSFGLDGRLQNLDSNDLGRPQSRRDARLAMRFKTKF